MGAKDKASGKCIPLEAGVEAGVAGAISSSIMVAPHITQIRTSHA